MTKPVIELARAVGSTGKPYILFRDPDNHEILSTSEPYFSRGNRNRAIRKMVEAGNGVIVEAQHEVVRLPD